MDPATITAATFILMQGTAPVECAVTYAGTVATFNPTIDLAIDATYTATITTDAKDMAGTSLAANKTWTFTTVNHVVHAGESIQAAIDSAIPGDTISIDPGTFDEVIYVDKRITLSGAGSGDAGTMLTRTTVVNPAPYPGQVDGVTYSYNPILIISASGTAGNPILIKDMMICPRQDLIGAARQNPAILFGPGAAGSGYVASYSYIELNNIRVRGTHSFGTPESGVVIDGSTSLYHFVVRNSEFSNMGYGMIFFNNALNPGMVQYADVIDTAFNDNTIKGFYSEKLSDATFINVTASNNGMTSLSPSWAVANNAGIDINLTYGTYRNLVFDNLTVTANGIATDVINPNYGAGLIVKARGTGNDPSYSANPATLIGVTINGGTFTGNVTGIRFGEPGKSNTSPTSISVNGTIFAGNSFDVANLLSGVQIVNYAGNPQVIYVTLTSSMLALPAQFQTFGFGWDWDMERPEDAAITAGAPDPYFYLGNNAFDSNVLGGSSTVRKYTSFRIYPQAVFGGANITIGDIQSIFYWTKQKTPDGISNSQSDTNRTWQVKIYTVNPSATPALWFKTRLNTSLLYYSDSAWKMNSTDINLNFTGSSDIYDKINNVYIPYTTIGNHNGILADMRSGFGTESILFMDIIAGSSTPAPVIQSYLDGVTIKLTDGKIASIDLE
jgi:hypothetical protein